MMASLLNQLGRLVLAQGEGAAAEALHQRALAIYEARLGGESLKVAHTLLNLARATEQQARWDRARAYAERARGLFEAHDVAEAQQQSQRLLDALSVRP